MNNFLDFINSDIEAKKTLIQSLPTNNKTNQKKYNQKIDDILKSYNYYKEAVTKYINAKSASFKYSSQKHDIEKTKKSLDDVKDMLFMFNNNNSYKEKLKLDEAIYDINSYSEYTFEDINIFISNLIEKFKKAGVNLKEDDFNLTSYVNKYMSAYFSSNGNYDNLSKVFEEIYWRNHDIIKHIELNFIVLIDKYKKNFEEYISAEKKRILDSMKFTTKDELQAKYSKLYKEYHDSLEEDIADIVEKAIKNDIDINNYFDDSKFRCTTLSTLTINEIDYSDENTMNKLLSVLERLKENTIEYKNYLKFMPLFTYFKENYSKKKTPTDIENQIKKVEKDISTLYSKITHSSGSSLVKNVTSLFNKKSKVVSKSSDSSLELANKLYDLYVNRNKLLFEKQISSLQAEKTVYVSDVMKLFYSYTFFKIEVFKEIFDYEDTEQLVELCNQFDDFASNPTNVITKGINIDGDFDISLIISDRYRMENININSEDLDEDNLDALVNKIEFIKRIYKIEKSSLSVEKIWFIVQNSKLQNLKNEK